MCWPKKYKKKKSFLNEYLAMAKDEIKPDHSFLPVAKMDFYYNSSFLAKAILIMA